MTSLDEISEVSDPVPWLQVYRLEMDRPNELSNVVVILSERAPAALGDHLRTAGVENIKEVTMAVDEQLGRRWIRLTPQQARRLKNIAGKIRSDDPSYVPGIYDAMSLVTSFAEMLEGDW